MAPTVDSKVSSASVSASMRSTSAEASASSPSAVAVSHSGCDDGVVGDDGHGAPRIRTVTRDASPTARPRDTPNLSPRGQPPATAGMIEIFAPAGVGVARPSVNRTSSSST